jgi:hypothetical protein
MVTLLTIEDKDPNSGGGGCCGCDDYQFVCFFWWCCIPISIAWFLYTLADLCCGDCYRARKKKKQDKEQ